MSMKEMEQLNLSQTVHPEKRNQSSNATTKKQKQAMASKRRTTSRKETGKKGPVLDLSEENESSFTPPSPDRVQPNKTMEFLANKENVNELGKTQKQKQATQAANSEKQDTSPTTLEIGSRDNGLNVDSEVTFTPTVNNTTPQIIEADESVNVNTSTVSKQSGSVTNDEQTLNADGQTNTPAENDDAIVVSDTEIEEMIEVRFAEKIHHQTERLFDLIEDLERVNEAEWIEFKDQYEALGKLRMISEKINRVRRNTVDLPEFLERHPMRDQPGFEYILRAINAFKDARVQLEIAKNFVFKLPGIPDLASGDNRKKTVPGPVASSTSSLLEEARQNLKSKGQELDERMRKARESVQLINNQWQDATDLYTQKVPNSRRKQKPKSSGLPRITSKDDFPRPEFHVHEPTPPNQTPVWSNISVPPSITRSFHPKEYHGYDFGFPRSRNPASPLDIEWIEVQTKRHPQIGKPRHHGKLISFKNLFMNSFQSDKVYNPDAVGYNSSMSNFNVTPFDGKNIEDYPQFEQEILMTVVNNITENWDAKFFSLLASTTGDAHYIVRGYSGVLTMKNFVQAIEELYHAFGQPRTYRSVLFNKLTNHEFVDLKNRMSVSRVNLLVARLLHSIENDVTAHQKTDQKNCDKEEFDPQGYICESIKMTNEARATYKLYRMVNRMENNLQSLNDWLTYTLQNWDF